MKMICNVFLLLGIFFSSAPANTLLGSLRGSATQLGSNIQNVSAAAISAATQVAQRLSNCVPPGGYPLPSSLTPPDFTMDQRTLDAIFQLLSNPEPNPDLKRNFSQLITDYGYPLELHTIEGITGYILTYYRIPHEKNRPGSAPRPPVLLQHGLGTYGASWVATKQSDNIAFNLADNGYDVWISNIRGSQPSQGHKNPNLTPNDKAYWDFSWEQMGTEDIPAAIDYILNTTNNSQLYYVGHSMGTTMFFAGMSLKPEYCAKIRLMVALAPVGYLYHSTTAARLLSPLELALEYGQTVFDPVSPGQFLPADMADIMSTWFGMSCTPTTFSQLLCSQTFFSLMGYDYQQTNMTQLPVLLGHFLSPMGWKVLRHYDQSLIYNSFARFNHGPTKNREFYGSCFPPEYNVSAISNKVAFFFSNNDALANEQDVAKLSNKMTNLVLNYTIPVQHWNHIDYLVAFDIKQYVIDPLLKVMREN